MILKLAAHFQRLSHVHLKNSSSGLNPMTSAMPEQCSNQLSNEATVHRSICWAPLFPWKEWWVKEMCDCEVWSRDELKWSSHLLEYRQLRSQGLSSSRPLGPWERGWNIAEIIQKVRGSFLLHITPGSTFTLNASRSYNLLILFTHVKPAKCSCVIYVKFTRQWKSTFTLSLRV